MGKRRNPKDPPVEHRFKPGNPGGSSPKGKRISTWMVELGQLDVLPDPDKLPVNGKIALARIKKAMTPNGEYSTETILDRTEGKMSQTFKLEGDAITGVMTDEQKRQAAKNMLDNLKPIDGA